jgi:hypothetical protein
MHQGNFFDIFSPLQLLPGKFYKYTYSASGWLKKKLMYMIEQFLSNSIITAV